MPLSTSRNEFKIRQYRTNRYLVARSVCLLAILYHLVNQIQLVHASLDGSLISKTNGDHLVAPVVDVSAFADNRHSAHLKFSAPDAPLKSHDSQPNEARTGALIGSTQGPSSTTVGGSIAGQTTPASPPSSQDEDNLDDGLCSLSTVTRLSHVYSKPKLEVTERSLSCMGVDEHNYRQMVKSIYRRNKLNIQQIHITNSESLVVFSAIDLICDRFNCSRLTVFNVSGQEIHDYNVLSTWVASWPQLEILDLSNTSLAAIESILPVDAGPSVILKNLTSIHLNGNNIGELNLNFVLDRMPSLKIMSLQYNSIFNITCNESLRSRVRSQFESISLAGNAINCDKSQLWFMKQFQYPTTNLKFPDYEQIKCIAPERLSEMTWSQRISVLETRICDDCDCRSLKRTAISVDCHNKNLTSLPDILPLNTKILNLTSNRIDSIGVPQNSRNWENVTYVYLEDNLITSFQPLEFNSPFMRNLAALDIRKNKFQEFPNHIFEQFTNLDQVHLSDNPWLCDCEATFTFQEWLQRQFHKVGDKEEIKCGVSGGEENGLRSNALHQRLAARVIYRLSKSELCPQDNLEETYDWLDVLNIVLFVLILSIIAKVSMDYVYQHRTKRLPRFFKINF